MNKSLSDIVAESQRKIGDRVIYKGPLTADGSSLDVKCIITRIGNRNGRLIYHNSLGHWGYVSQYKDKE